MKLIVGLGNPGKEYETTRHNIGFLLIDFFAKKYNISIDTKKNNSLEGTTFINNEKIVFIKPQTYMNLSGQEVKKYIDYYNVSIQDILIIQDDKDMDLGKIKIVKNSSSGGHNGIKNIEAHLKTKDYMRLKIGIGSYNNKDTKNFVLDRFSKKELEVVFEKFVILEDIIEDLLNNDYPQLTCKYNGK